MLKIAIILSTTREGRFADKAAGWLTAIVARQYPGTAFEVVDLRDYPMPMFDGAGAPAFVPVTHPQALRWSTKISGFDGYIFVTAEYNRAIPAVLKNALDYSYYEFTRKPAAIVGYGGLGAAFAVAQLRIICPELQMATARNAVHISGPTFFDAWEDKADLADFDFLADDTRTMIDELLWWAATLKDGRQLVAS